MELNFFQELNDQSESYMPRRKRRPGDEISIRDRFADMAFEHATTPEQRTAVATGASRTVIVLAPTPAWVLPIAESIDALSETVNVIRRLDAKHATEESARAARWIGQGATVLYIAASPEHIPSWFRTIAQETIVVPSASVALVTKFVRKFCTGRLPKELSTLDCSVLDFDEIAALVRVGEEAAVATARIVEAIRRKTSTARANERLPDIPNGIEFGDAREWGMALKQDLDDYRAGRLPGSELDRGCVLHGDPGNGKTLYARALAQYLGVPIIISSFAEIFAQGTAYLDSAIRLQRANFAKARAMKPCIVFYDEIDQVPDLDKIDKRNRDYWAVLVADLLTQLDGAGEDREGIIVIGATNRVEALSPALVRPGRLERSIHMGRPTADGIARIIKHHAVELEGADVSGIASMMAARSMSAAEVMESVRSAKRSARRLGRPLELSDLGAKVLPDLSLGAEWTRRVSIHEAAHAVVGLACSSVPLRSLTMGGDEAFASFDVPVEGAQTLEMLEGTVGVMLAGRMAESLWCGGPCTGGGGGADSDLGKATRLLARARCSYGLRGSHWRCDPENVQQAIILDSTLRQKIDEDIEVIEYRVRGTLVQNEALVMALAAALVEHRHLTRPAIDAIVDRVGLAYDRKPPDAAVA